MARSARTISHDLTGVINVIRGSADFARAKLEPNHPAAPDLARIIRACEDTGALAKELRALTLLDPSASA